MRIGLFGGSFNPIHNGHIAAAEAARQEFSLDTVLFMTAGDPPHKEIAGGVPAQNRYEMTRLALVGREGLAVSDLEMQREGKSYTADTMDALRALYPGAKVFCIVGADMLFTLDSWHDAPHLLSPPNAFIGVSRGGVSGSVEKAAQRLQKVFGAEMYLTSFAGPELSSTMVREAVFSAKPAEDMLPEAAYGYLYEKGLYVPEHFRILQEKVRAALKDSRYRHTMGTVREAISLACRFGADPERSRLAALLHDYAKRPQEEQSALAASFPDAAEEFSHLNPAVLHGPLSAALARRELGITDEAVLSAIRCHTVCREHMTVLDKVLYLADKIEPTRDYPGAEVLRQAAKADLDRAVLLCMEQSVRHVETEGGTLDPRIFAARDAILKELNKNKSK